MCEGKERERGVGARGSTDGPLALFFKALCYGFLDILVVCIIFCCVFVCGRERGRGGGNG